MLISRCFFTFYFCLMGISCGYSSAYDDSEITYADFEDHDSFQGFEAPLEAIPDDIQYVFQLYQERSKGLAQEMDVHISNGLIKFKEIIPTVLTHDKWSRGDYTLAEVKQDALHHGDFDDIDPTRLLIFFNSFDQLAGHIHYNPVEGGETGVRSEELVSRIWSLIGRAEYQQAIELETQFFETMCSNTETNGGCYPGYAGRLARLYLTFVRPYWFHELDAQIDALRRFE